MYKECNDDSAYPVIGSRVIRGDGWCYGKQDGNGPGTIIGHDVKEKLCKHACLFVCL